MDLVEQYLNSFFENYASRVTQKEKIIFLESQIKLLHGEAYKTSLSDLKARSDAILFITGFMKLETGETFEFNLSNFHNRCFYELGKGLELYLNAQREWNYKKAELAEKHINSVNQTTKGYIWFLHHKLGKVCFLKGNLHYEERKKLYNEALKIFDEIIEILGDSNKIPQPYNAKGDVYLKQRKYADLSDKLFWEDEAEKAFRQALQIDPKYSPALNGLGNLYRKKRSYQNAIKNYESALEIDPQFFFARYYLGDCYRLLEDHDQAEREYLKALKLAKHPYAYYGLGRTYYELANRAKNTGTKIDYYIKALKHLEEALAINTNFPRPFREKARVLEKLKDYEGAFKFYSLAAENFKYFESEYQSSLSIACAEEMQSIIQLKNICNADKEDETGKLLCLTNNDLINIEEHIFELKDNFYNAFLKKELQKDYHVNYLEVLKRWNSYTPLIADNSRGGGYFLKLNGKGIVIDPGFDFISNFRARGHRFDEIDMVMVSHSHDDHTADLEAIISLLYRFNRGLREDSIPREIAKEKDCSTQHARDHFAAEIDRRYSDAKKHIEFFISDGVWTKFKGLFESDKECNKYNPPADNPAYLVDTVKAGDRPKDNIIAINAYHPDKLSDSPPLGFVFDTGNKILFYSGDTGWTNCKKLLEDIKRPVSFSMREEIENLLKDPMFKTVKGDKKKIVLLAHIGGFEKRERLHLVYSHDKNPRCPQYTEKGCNYPLNPTGFEDIQPQNCPYYEYHLGRLGLVQLLKLLNPEICIISEWGEEFKDYRLDVTRAFSAAFSNTKQVFLTADVGFKINLNNGLVNAITGIDNQSRTIIYGSIDPKCVEEGKVKMKNSLFYYAREFGPSLTDCIEAIIDGYQELDDVSLKYIYVAGQSPIPPINPLINYYTLQVDGDSVDIRCDTNDPSAQVFLNFKPIEKTRKVTIRNDQLYTITVRNNFSSKDYQLRISKITPLI